MNSFDIIFIGDIVGRAGRKAVKLFLAEEKKENDFVIVNAENAAGGFGLTQKVYNELVKSGANLLSGGNHIWDKSGIAGKREMYPCLALPANLPKGAGDHPVIHVEHAGVPLSLINLSGRIFMPAGANDPFTVFDEIYAQECVDRLVIVDFHGEATSEKAAFAEYTKGRAAAVLGTHTHVQTSDERILQCGTFFISDVGSCCATNSILGMTVESSLARFIEPERRKMIVETTGPIMVNAVRLKIEAKKVVNFERLKRIYN